MGEPLQTTSFGCFATARGCSPRGHVPMMKILATAAKDGRASAHDAMTLIDRACEYFGRRDSRPSTF